LRRRPFIFSWMMRSAIGGLGGHPRWAGAAGDGGGDEDGDEDGEDDASEDAGGVVGIRGRG